MFTGSLRAIITGIAATVVLIALLAASRLFRVSPESEHTEIVDISTYLPPPEEPPMEEQEPEEKEEQVDLVLEALSAPIPALDLIVAPHLDAPALPATAVRFSPHMNVDVMQMDRPPAALPMKTVARPTANPTSSPTTKPRSKPPRKTQQKRGPAPVKPYYSPRELDGRPREIRQGRFTWPSRAKGRSGTVSLSIEINSSGRVSVLGVRSTTDAALNAAAKKLARTSRYTAPKKNGRAVKARFSKTYRLIKPR